MNLNGIAQACLERNHCRFFSSSLSTSSLVITGVGNGNGKWENPQGRRDLHVLLFYSTTALLDHVVIWSR